MTEQNKKKRKLTLNTIGLILLAVVIAANFYVWNNKAAAVTKETGLTASLAAAQQQLDDIAPPPDGLDARLEAAEAALAETQTGFPYSVDLNEVVDYLLDVAEECSVDVLPLFSGGWTVENYGQDYRVLSIDVTAEGSLENVKKLMTVLLTGRYPTLTVTDCSVARSGSGISAFPGNEMPVTVSMKIGIYTFIAEGESIS